MAGRCASPPTLRCAAQNLDLQKDALKRGGAVKRSWSTSPAARTKPAPVWNFDLGFRFRHLVLLAHKTIDKLDFYG
jgi:hypothetical protein